MRPSQHKPTNNIQQFNLAHPTLWYCQQAELQILHLTQKAWHSRAYSCATAGQHVNYVYKGKGRCTGLHCFLVDTVLNPIWIHLPHVTQLCCVCCPEKNHSKVVYWNIAVTVQFLHLTEPKKQCIAKKVLTIVHNATPLQGLQTEFAVTRYPVNELREETEGHLAFFFIPFSFFFFFF